MMRLLLAGGGHAQLAVLDALARLGPAGLEVTLVTPSPFHYYSGMLPGWMAGHYDKAQCRIDLAALVQAAGARLETSPVVGMDAGRRRVALADGSHIEYDLLSLDVGSEVDLSWKELAGGKLLPVKPLGEFFETWPGVLAAARHKRDFVLAVVGGGAAGVEIALAARYALTFTGADARVDLVASEDGLLAGFANGIRQRVRHLLADAGIVVHCQRGVGREEGVLLSDGKLLAADAVIAATGAQAPAWLKLSGLMLDEDGYVAVDDCHRSLSHPNVFAAGDVCARQDVTLARSGVHAVHAGPVLAENLLATLRQQPLVPYRPRRHSLYLLACGPKYAVASWGGWHTEGKWVWRWKGWIDRRFVARFSDPSRRNQGNREGTSCK